MENHVTILDWDSDFFGYQIGRINANALNEIRLKGLIEEAKADGYKLIYLFTSPSDEIANAAASTVGAKLVDQKVTFRILNPEMTGVNEKEHIADYPSDEPSPKLIELSLQSGIYSRYKIDKNFKQHEFERLYRAWIENSVNKKIVNRSFVFVEDGEELGVVTAMIKPEGAHIGIIAVDEHARGKSIGSRLMKHLMFELKDKGIPLLDVATQVNNESACNFYKKLGFKEHTLDNIYHIWL
ncbi:MAG: GNAT family N-acetyltransferase [Ferruginibacter sp.]|nr:GNAT family N-acetyltransferase [Ferruginibacter sp.]